GGLLFRLNKVCYQDKDGYPQAKGTKWEWEEYQPDNVSIPYVFTNIRDSDKKEQFVISVTKTKADLCIRSIGRIPVGISDCTLILTIEGVNNSSFTASHNTYFVCGNYGYYQLPIGWSGVCYVSFLLPPVFLAPASYHRDFKLFNDIIKNRYKRAISTNEVDQTDTSLQQYVDFNLGLFSFVGAALNSRKVRRLTRVVEAVTNQAALALGNITEELQIARIVALQNRMVLDVILADRGGACRIIGSSCCVFIPDHSPSVYDAISKWHKIAAEIHTETGTWTFSGWFWALVSAWGWKLLTILCVMIAIFFTCCICIQCGPMFCSMCITACMPTKRNITDMKAQHMLDKEIAEM
ncbi:hypothetical protein NDU88_005454, partial [Pleurodeles waltl]